MRARYLIVFTTLLAIPHLRPTNLEADQDRGRVPQGPPGTVTLPIGDYDRLVDRAAQPGARPDPPPIAAVGGRAEIRARVDGASVRGSIRVDGEVFQRGQVKVPLVSGTTLLDARTDGRPLPVMQDGEGHAAVLPGPAPFSVTIEWAAPIGTTPGRASFTLPQAAAGSISAIVDLPGDPADIRVEPGLVTRRETAAGRTTAEITLPPATRAQVSWSVRETQSPIAATETRTLSDVKSLVTIGDGDLRIAAVVDVTVVRGEPRTLEVRVPNGYEVASVNGATLETSSTKGDIVTLTVRETSRRRHQFVLALEQAHSPGSFKIETSFPTVLDAQRESGEAAVEGIGTLEITAAGDDSLRRMDVREANATLRSLARQPLLAAFRYQRRPGETREPQLALDVKRFADASVIAAAAEHAVATTLVTSEGRMLTEVLLWIRNRAQPFMKVALPAGATMLSAEVAGETAKPVLGADGTRIPLLRTGFRPDGPYAVSFVYLHAGQAFGKRGHAQMTLPTIDVPVNLLEWELFLPEQYSAKPIAGNVIPARLLASSTGETAQAVPPSESYLSFLDNAGPGQIVGRVTDPTGASLPGATITLHLEGRTQQTVVSDDRGRYTLRAVPSGLVVVRSELTGFQTATRAFAFDQQSRQLDFRLQLAAVMETVTVRAEAPEERVDRGSNRRNEETGQTQQAPSQNIINMQRRVAGVLPVRIDVPRAGTSYRFFRPLVLEEGTEVQFRYKRR